MRYFLRTAPAITGGYINVDIPRQLAMVKKIPPYKPVIISLLMVACALVLIARKPWSFSREEDTAEIITLLENNVPEDGMVLTLPFRSMHGEVALCVAARLSKPKPRRKTRFGERIYKRSDWRRMN